MVMVAFYTLLPLYVYASSRVGFEGLGSLTAIKLNPLPQSNLIAGRPKADLLFWFFDDFRCGVLFFL